MKHHLYKYQEKDVRLEFSFAEDDKLTENKKIFLELLNQASKDLAKELK